jgi:Protein of unknown function (DUF4197)
MITRRGFSIIAAAPQLDKILEKLRGVKSGALTDGRIADGLKEALRIGAGNAVSITGKKDGFLLNLAIKILLPEPILKAERGLRLVGMGKQLDELVVGMNRAAETAAPLAKDIFLNAIMEMSFDDAKAILRGSETAATDFFRTRTTPKLTELFRPPVAKVMGEVGVTRQWNAVFSRLKALPLAKTDPIDFEGYVVTKGLNGLFFVLGQEETKIRKDPAARVTSILQEVFGAR